MLLIEASSISFTLLQKLRTAFVSAVWSKRMPPAHVGAVLTLLDGPQDRRYLAYRPLEVPRPYNLPGSGPMHLLLESANDLGFSWDPLSSGWIWPGLPLLHQLAGPYQHFKAAIWDAWRSKVCFDLC